MQQKSNQPDHDTQIEIYRRMALLKANDDLWAESAGRVTGPCEGKGGPMHLTYPARGGRGLGVPEGRRDSGHHGMRDSANEWRS